MRRTRSKFKFVVAIPPGAYYCYRWLDTEFVMLDANFRLKLKQRNLEDPPARWRPRVFC